MPKEREETDKGLKLPEVMSIGPQPVMVSDF